MIILGLTGSIGMGKSTTAQMFRDENISVHDADKTVHDLYRGEAVAPIAKLFPQAIVEGVVDRKILGSFVLNNSENMKKLEKLVHPLVGKKEQEFLKAAKKDNAKLVVLDIPLLFETGAENRVDKILVVTASAKIQKKRVLSRSNMDEKKFTAILNRQTPDADKRARADFVIDTGLGMDHARAKVREIIQTLKGQASSNA